MAQSAAANLALASADAFASPPGAAEGAVAAGAEVAGAALVLGAGLLAEVSWPLSLFLQPPSNTSGRTQQIIPGRIFMDAPR
jgi:hypothetical protein